MHIHTVYSIIYSLFFSLFFFAISFCCFLLQQPTLPMGIIKVSSHIYRFWSGLVEWPCKNKHFFSAFYAVCSMCLFQSSFTAHSYLSSSNWWTKFNHTVWLQSRFRKTYLDQDITQRPFSHAEINGTNSFYWHSCPQREFIIFLKLLGLCLYVNIIHVLI